MANSGTGWGGARSLRQRMATLSSDSSGAVLVEFAIVGTAFIALMLATLYLLMVFLAQQMLETAAEKAGRLLLTGVAQTASLSNGQVGMTADDFKTAICHGTTASDSNGTSFTVPAMLPPMLQCSRLTVNVSTASGYNTASTSAPIFSYDSDGNVVSTGTDYSYRSGGAGQNQIVALQLIYLWPTGTGLLGSSLINQPNSNRMLVATSVFTTEDYTCNSGQTSC